MKNNNKPVWRASLGGLAASAWRNERRLPSGQTVERTAIRIERRYKDDSGEWQSTNSYSLGELHQLRHFLSRVIDLAYKEREAAEE